MTADTHHIEAHAHAHEGPIEVYAQVYNEMGDYAALRGLKRCPLV